MMRKLAATILVLAFNSMARNLLFSTIPVPVTPLAVHAFSVHPIASTFKCQKINPRGQIVGSSSGSHHFTVHKALVGDDESSSPFSTDDENTVVTLNIPSSNTASFPTNSQITLIGTAHLSEQSNAQVQRLIRNIQPNVILVELDPSRLHRIGIRNKESINVQDVRTSEAIDVPTSVMDASNSPLFFILEPLKWVQELVTEAVSRLIRVFLTNMYDNMSEAIAEDPETIGAGGEFLVAIREAEALQDVTLILGDRSSVTTIKRAATLAWESGNPLGVWNRLQQVNQNQMRILEDNIRRQLHEESGAEVEEKDVTIAMMESLKEDSAFREKLFERLEHEVPEFTRAFLDERDYIMSEALLDAIMDSSTETTTVVAVVGLAHVAGMEAHIQARIQGKEVPLERALRSESMLQTVNIPQDAGATP